MYQIVRLIIGFIIFGVCLIIIKKSKTLNNKKALKIVAFVGAMLFCSMLAKVPFENTFLTFSSPESAYRYSNQADIMLVLNGEVSDMVVGSSRGINNYLIMPKVKDGSKIGVGTNINQIFSKSSGPLTVRIYQYENTEDYYISVINLEIGSYELLDNRNTNFQNIKRIVQVGGEEYYYSYWGYIHDFNSDYVLTVNGTDVTFEDYIAK